MPVITRDRLPLPPPPLLVIVRLVVPITEIRPLTEVAVMVVHPIASPAIIPVELFTVATEGLLDEKVVPTVTIYRIDCNDCRCIDSVAIPPCATTVSQELLPLPIRYSGLR